MPGCLIMVSMLIGPGLPPSLLLENVALLTSLLLFLLSLQFLRPEMHRWHLRLLTVLLMTWMSMLRALLKPRLEPLMANMFLVVDAKPAIPELVPLCVVIPLVFIFEMVRLSCWVRWILLCVASRTCILVLGVMMAATLWFLVITLVFLEKELIEVLCVTQVCRVVTNMRCMGTTPDIPDMREEILEEWTVLSTLLLLVHIPGLLGLMSTLKRLLAKNLLMALAMSRLLTALVLKLTFPRTYY